MTKILLFIPMETASSLEVSEFFKESISTEYTPPSLCDVYKSNNSNTAHQEANVRQPNEKHIPETTEKCISLPKKSSFHEKPQDNFKNSSVLKASNISTTKSSTYQSDLTATAQVSRQPIRKSLSPQHTQAQQANYQQRRKSSLSRGPPPDTWVAFKVGVSCRMFEYMCLNLKIEY